MARRERFIYGAGEVFATIPTTVPQIVKAATLQEVQVTIDPGSLNKLYGAKKYPVAVAQGEANLTAKAKMATLQPDFVKLALGGTPTVGGEIPVVDEAHTIPATPFEVVVTGGADMNADLGVIDVTAGLVMTAVAIGATPTTGQYKYDPATGTYTFAAADTTHAVKISYTKAMLTGDTLLVTNTLMGAATTFAMDFYNVATSGKKFGMHVYAAVAGKLALAFSNKGWAIPDLDIEGMADADDNVFRFFNEAQ